MHDDDYLRERIIELEDRIDNEYGETPEGSLCEFVTLFEEDEYPTEPNKFFAAHPTSIGGTEDEGESASFNAANDRKIYVYNVGSQVPPEGTKIMATLVGRRWVIRFDGDGT